MDGRYNISVSVVNIFLLILEVFLVRTYKLNEIEISRNFKLTSFLSKKALSFNLKFKEGGSIAKQLNETQSIVN